LVMVEVLALLVMVTVWAALVVFCC
jgi:hypothetical protein